MSIEDLLGFRPMIGGGRSIVVKLLDDFKMPDNHDELFGEPIIIIDKKSQGVADRFCGKDPLLAGFNKVNTVAANGLAVRGLLLNPQLYTNEYAFLYQSLRIPYDPRMIRCNQFNFLIFFHQVVFMAHVSRRVGTKKVSVPTSYGLGSLLARNFKDNYDLLKDLLAESGSGFFGISLDEMENYMGELFIHGSSPLTVTKLVEMIVKGKPDDLFTFLIAEVPGCKISDADIEDAKMEGPTGAPSSGLPNMSHIPTGPTGGTEPAGTGAAGTGAAGTGLSGTGAAENGPAGNGPAGNGAAENGPSGTGGTEPNNSGPTGVCRNTTRVTGPSILRFGTGASGAPTSASSPSPAGNSGQSGPTGINEWKCKGAPIGAGTASPSPDEGSEPSGPPTKTPFTMPTVDELKEKLKKRNTSPSTGPEFSADNVKRRYAARKAGSASPPNTGSSNTGSSNTSST